MVLSNILKTIFTIGFGMVTFCGVPSTESIEKNYENKTESIIVSAENISIDEAEDQPRGLIALVSLNLVSDHNGYITAIVENTFTLFPATVPAVVELYYSYTYQEDYNNMILAGRDMTSDLNMGESISVTASTNGETRYWLARSRDRLDSGEWRYATAGPFYYDGNGNLLN